MVVDKPSVLLVGLGSLGSILLELLVRDGAAGHILVGSRNAERGHARCNLTRLAALAQGLNPSIEFAPLDLHQPDTVAETIHRAAPDLIVSTATMQTWWLPDLLPPEANAVKQAPFGAWLPVHLMLTVKLMEAVQAAGFRGSVLTAPYPDVVNCILARLGMAPTSGVGNVDEVAAKVRLLAVAHLCVPPDSVRVFLVAHHALGRVALHGSAEEPPPHFLRIEYEGRNVTDEIRAEELLLAAFPIPSGPVIHFLTAGCTARLIRAMLSDGETLLHAPAPNGLPGGYPVVASRHGVRPAPIPGLSLGEAVSINERSHPFDGLDRIEKDGTAVFTPSVVETLRSELGYDCARLQPAEAEPRARELMERFREYAGRYGVQLPS